MNVTDSTFLVTKSVKGHDLSLGDDEFNCSCSLKAHFAEGSSEQCSDPSHLHGDALSCCRLYHVNTGDRVSEVHLAGGGISGGEW